MSELITIPISTAKYYQEYFAKRSPSWRYELAHYHSSSAHPPRPGQLDKPTQYLRQYLRKKESLTRYRHDEMYLQHKLSRKYGPLWNAEEIFTGGNDDPVRYCLEAQLLTDRPMNQVAQMMGVDVDTVRLYEALFFNVKDKLASRHYIARVVIPPIFMSGLASRTPELTAKYFAYFGGPLVLDLIMDAIDNSLPIPEDASELSRWIDHQFRLTLRTGAMVGVKFLEPTNFNIRSMVEGYTTLLSLAHREQAEAGEDTTLAQALSVFAQTTKPPLGDAANKLPSRPGRIYADGVVEPRLSEVYETRGEESPPSLIAYEADDFVNPFGEKFIRGNQQDIPENPDTDHPKDV